MWSPEILIATALIFLLGGIVKGVSGIGLPTVTIVLMAAFVGLKEGIALMILPTFVTNVWQGLVGGYLLKLLRRMWSLLLMAAVGAWIGAGILAGADAMYLAAFLGVLLCVYSAVSLVTPQVPPPGRAEPWLSPIVGGTAGLIGGMTGNYAVPGAVYLQALGLPRDALVQALGIAFLFFTLVLGLALAWHGVMTPSAGALSAAAVAPSLAGMAFGQRLRRHLSESAFRRIFFVLLMGMGAWLIVRPFIG